MCRYQASHLRTGICDEEFGRYMPGPLAVGRVAILPTWSGRLDAACREEPLLGLADHERLPVRGAVRVEPACRAVARRGARHGEGLGKPALVQGARGGHLDRLPPGAVALADHERLLVTGAVRVEPACRAVARRRARHGEGLGTPALVQGARTGHVDRLAPGAVALADHERLLVTGAVRVEPACRAVARRGARHGEGFSSTALVQGAQGGHLDRL